MRDKPREVRGRVHEAYFTDADYPRNPVVWEDGSRDDDDEYVPAILRPYDAGDPPPDWPEGTRVVLRLDGNYHETVGPGDIHRDHHGMWRFYTLQGGREFCADWRPVPPRESVTLRVTGEGAGTVVKAIIEGRYGLDVEVVEDE